MACTMPDASRLSAAMLNRCSRGTDDVGEGRRLVPRVRGGGPAGQAAPGPPAAAANLAQPCQRQDRAGRQDGAGAGPADGDASAAGYLQVPRPQVEDRGGVLVYEHAAKYSRSEPIRQSP